MERTHKLKPETTEKINKIDGSILFWSLQLGQVMMRLREVEAQVSNLYDFKRTAILDDLKAQDVSIEGCDVSTIDPETVMIKTTQSHPPQPVEVPKPGE